MLLCLAKSQIAQIKKIKTLNLLWHGVKETEVDQSCFNDTEKWIKVRVSEPGSSQRRFTTVGNTASRVTFTDYGHPERKKPSLHGRKFTPTPKHLDTAEAYFVCHIGPIFHISLIYPFIWCP